MSSGGRQRGFALVVVLWVVAALSLIAGAMLASSMTSAKIEKNAWTQIEVRNAADTAVQSTIMSLFDPGKPLALDGRVQRSRVGGTALAVSIQDEGGLIDLNHASVGLLKTLVKAGGVDAEAADTLVARIVYWRSPPQEDSSLAGDDDGGDRSFRPRRGSFQSLDELKLVPGLSPEIYDRIAPALTIYGRPTGDFDTRVAPRAVLMLVPGIDGDRADVALAARTGELVIPRHVFTIVATAEASNIRFSRRAAVRLTGDPQKPYEILDWQ
ncbi:MAG: general secretion pathway protein GspK [Alphaproteobacteria bacterium]|nr:general secretion pathway protein GspK [Alphaproteobacteria bacterium]MBL7098339.1 general secretion pathway protein GspK [Alphaproteobacteria bacterium]